MPQDTPHYATDELRRQGFKKYRDNLNKHNASQKRDEFKAALEFYRWCHGHISQDSLDTYRLQSPNYRYRSATYVKGLITQMKKLGIL